VINAFSYGLGAEMLNFGALIAFMGVNLAAFVRYYLRERGRFVDKYLTPAVTIIVIACFLLGAHLGSMDCRRRRIAGAGSNFPTNGGFCNLLFSLVES
jgi:hypothetical protein